MASESVKLIIQAEVKKAIGEMKKFNKELIESQKKSKKSKKSFSDLSSVMTKATVVVGGLYTVYKSLIAPASELEEAHNKFSVVFGENIEKAEEWATVLVDSYAMSSREAYKYLSSVQDLLVPMGMQSDAAAEMSNEVVKLAADLGSFNDVPTGQVINDINSALVGNFETMKKYGVVLNETVIKNEALAMGLWNGKGVVDANTKAQVAFKLAMAGSAAAQGDMARTSSSWANVSKKLLSIMEDTWASLGSKLLPSLSALGTALISTAKSGGIVIKTFGMIADSLGFVIATYGSAIAFMNSFSTKSKSNELSKSASNSSMKFKTLRANIIETYGSMKAFKKEQTRGNKLAIAEAKELEKYGKNALKLSAVSVSVANSNVSALQATQDAMKNNLDSLQGIVQEQEQIVVSSSNVVKEKVINNAKEVTAAKKTALDGYNSYARSNTEKEIAEEQEKFEALIENKYLENEQKQLIEEEHQAILKEIKLKAAADAMEIAMQGASQIASGVSNVFNLMDKKDNIKLSNKKKKEKAHILATIKDKDKQKIALDALDEKYAKKENDLKRKQAKKQKAMDIVMATISMLTGVAASLKMGAPVGIIMAAITLAAGIATIATIASTPIPAAAEGALIQGSQKGTTMLAGEGGKTEAIIPLENEEAMDKLAPIMGGMGGGTTIINIENLYGDETLPETVAMAIDQAMLNLKQNDNSAFATSIGDDI